MRNLLRTGILSLLLTMSGLVFGASPVVLKTDHPNGYTVKSGDTLWAIASLFLRDPWRWQDIWEINPQIKNPHLIFPGDELYLEYVEGQPRLKVRRGNASNTVKLTPKARIEPMEQAIPVIAMEVIHPFLHQHRIVSDSEMEAAPYVLTGAQGHLLAGAGSKVFARGKFDVDEKGLSIYRQGNVYVDPITGEHLGDQAMDVGSGRVLQVRKELATIEVTRMVTNVRQGDRLMPVEQRVINATFSPRVPDIDIRGFMIAVEGGVTQIGALSVVAINRGIREGLEEGHILEIYRKGEVVYDRNRDENVQMPDDRAGMVMIFRCFEKMSYGIVLVSDRPLSVMDKVRSPYN